MKKDIQWRVGLVYLLVFGFALFVASKVVFLQFIQGDQWRTLAEKTRVQNFEIQPHRGDILAEDMRLLATSIPYYEIRMDMTVANKQLFDTNIAVLGQSLHRLFGDKSAYEYVRSLRQARNNKKQYHLIKLRVDYKQLQELKTFPIFREGQFGGGFIYKQRSRRIRPHGVLAERTIGKTTQSERGNIVGIEGAFDDLLGGTKGIQRMQKLSGGDWMPIDDDGEIEPEDGCNVVTAIDINLQDVAFRALKTQLELHKAQHGIVVLMEVKTGDIKAIVNLKRINENYYEAYNYAIGASTEPGSTFKLPALITVFEDGYVKLTDSIDTGNGVWKPYETDNFVIKDANWRRGGHGVLTVQEVFELSSNIGMAKIIMGAYKNNPTRFVDRLYSMGLNKPLGIPIAGEGAPFMKYPNDRFWSGVSLAQMAYGYEVQQTPLQILTFYNAIANDGKMVKPRFVKEVRNHGKTIKIFPPEILNPSVCSKSTLKKVKTILSGVVESEHGTATNLRASHFKIAGKTGTSQIFNEKYGYKGGKVSHQASFVGYFPADAPKYSCIVVVNAPSQNVYYGNLVAGPVFLEIANRVYATSLDLQTPLNNIIAEEHDLPASKNGHFDQTWTAFHGLEIPNVVRATDANSWVVTQRANDTVKLLRKRHIENLMPDVRIMGLKDAIYLLENLGLQVEVLGRGSIKRQSIPAGTRISQGQKVTLEMSFIEG